MAWTRGGLRSLALAAPLLAAGAVTVLACVACSSTSSNAGPLAGYDGGALEDAPSGSPEGSVPVGTSDAEAACSPASVATYAPRWTPPKARASSCTSDQITSYARCLDSNDTASTYCAPWFGSSTTANATCRACFADSASTDATWGPIVDFGSGARQLNVAGCIALATGDGTGAGCASQYQELQGCEMDACAANCASSSAALAACVTDADNGGCNHYVASASCAADAGAGSCVPEAGDTFGDVFARIAPAFCLVLPDAGADHDSGSPAGDGDGGVTSDDAGDGGD